MKAYIFILILAVLSCFNTANALRCYHCEGDSLEECKGNVVLKTCASGYDSCLSIDYLGAYYRDCYITLACQYLNNYYPGMNAKCCSGDGCNTIPGFNGVVKIKPNLIAWLAIFGIIKYFF